jgi:hypothetical protein
MRMTKEKARIADYKARLFVLEQKLENTEDLSLENIQGIIRETSRLEIKIDCAKAQIDSGKRTKANEVKVNSKLYSLSLLS